MKLLSTNFFDRLLERSSRLSAQRISRRSLISVIGNAVVASAALPLLPVQRKAQAGELQLAVREECADQGRDPVQLLALLCERRVPLRVLRRRPEHLSAGDGAVSDVLDRLMRESGGRQNLPDRLSGLLRRRLMRPMRLSRPGRRHAELPAAIEQRHHLVLRRLEHGVPLLERGARRSRELRPCEAIRRRDPDGLLVGKRAPRSAARGHGACGAARRAGADSQHASAASVEARDRLCRELCRLPRTFRPLGR